jgi:hypothetical protein
MASPKFIVKGHFRNGKWIDEHDRTRSCKSLKDKKVGVKKSRRPNNDGKLGTTLSSTLRLPQEMTEQIDAGLETWNRTIADLGIPVGQIDPVDYLKHLIDLGLKQDGK